MPTFLLSFTVILLALLGLGVGALVHGRSLDGRCCKGSSCADGASCREMCRERQNGVDR